MMSLEGIAENIAADVIFLLSLVIIGWLWVTFSRRRRLQLFFGVSQTKRIIVYLSNLRVLTFGAVGISGRKMSYRGSAVAYGEMRASSRIRRLFSFFIPSLAESSDFLRQLLISDVSVDEVISPLTKNELEATASYIALGSPAFNAGSQAIEDTYNYAKFRLGVLKRKDVDDKSIGVRATAFSTEAEPVIVASGTASSYPWLVNQDSGSEDISDQKSAIIVEGLPPFEDPINAFVQRIVDDDGKRSLFYVAGLSEHSTEGAANFLVSEWRNLYKKFGKGSSFLAVLRISNETTDKWTVLFDKKL